MPTSPRSPVVWFAVIGAPAAWAFEFGVSYWLAEARCSVAGRDAGFSIDPWVVAAGAIGLAIGGAALVTALVLRRATDGADSNPPLGRVHFLAVIGVALSPLFLAIIAMNTVGVGVLESCAQS